MVTVTMDQIIAFRNAGDFFGDTVLPLKVAYKLNKIRKAVAAEGEFYSEKFQDIVNEYAQKDENGNIVSSDDGQQILIIEGKVDECNQALADLQELTVEIDNYNLTIDDFGDDLTCKPEDLEALMPFLE